MEIKDKNGKTETEFLREYDVTKYFRPSVTVDAVLYRPTPRGIRLLMVKRGGHPYIGCYAFPGGFVERDEDCETSAARELEEETHVRGVPLRQLVTVSTPGRDPRWRNITVVFCAEVPADIDACGDDDAAAAEWVDVTYDAGRMHFAAEDDEFDVELDIVRDAFGRIDINRTMVTKRGLAAFDHAKVVAYLTESLER